MYRLPTLAALCLTAAVAFAQNTPPPAPPPGGAGIERMALLLDLDAGQKVAVEKILTEQRQQMIAERKQYRESGQRPNREEMQANFAKKRAETLDKLRPVLSDVQLRKYEALTDHPRGPGPWGRGKHPDKAP